MANADNGHNQHERSGWSAEHHRLRVYSVRKAAMSGALNADRVAIKDDSNPAASTAASRANPPDEMGTRAPRAIAAGPTAIAAAIAPRARPAPSSSAFSDTTTAKRCDGR